MNCPYCNQPRTANYCPFCGLSMINVTTSPTMMHVISNPYPNWKATPVIQDVVDRKNRDEDGGGTNGGTGGVREPRRPMPPTRPSMAEALSLS